MGKNPPANARATKGTGLIPGSGRSPAGGHGNPPQYSCLESPMDRGAWRTAVHRAAKLEMAEHAHSGSSFGSKIA